VDSSVYSKLLDAVKEFCNQERLQYVKANTVSVLFYEYSFAGCYWKRIDAEVSLQAFSDSLIPDEKLATEALFTSLRQSFQSIEGKITAICAFGINTHKVGFVVRIEEKEDAGR